MDKLYMNVPLGDDNVFRFDEKEYVDYLNERDRFFRYYIMRGRGQFAAPFFLRFKFRNAFGKSFFISFKSKCAITDRYSHISGFRVCISGQAFNEANKDDLKLAFDSILSCSSANYDFSSLDRIIDKQLLYLEMINLRGIDTAFLVRKIFIENKVFLEKEDLDRVLTLVRERINLERSRCEEIVSDSSKLRRMGLTTLDELNKYKGYNPVLIYIYFISFVFNIASFVFMLYLSMYSF